ncbi:MAG: hypothetical protein WC438_03575 [Candidatus Pacearchaeota archaeon]
MSNKDSDPKKDKSNPEEKRKTIFLNMDFMADIHDPERGINHGTLIQKLAIDPDFPIKDGGTISSMDPIFNTYKLLSDAKLGDGKLFCDDVYSPPENPSYPQQDQYLSKQPPRFK